MRTALFGGTFDPVHLGHMKAARAVADALSLDRVFFIPANIPPHKGGVHVSGMHRKRMLALATEGDARFFVSEFELEREETNYSFITAEYFAKLYPLDTLYFITGDEAYNLLHTWKTPERIRAVADFVVVTRDNTPPPKDALYVRMDAVDISSTEVRRRLEEGEDASDLLPEAVYTYIKEKGLYKKKEVF